MIRKFFNLIPTLLLIAATCSATDFYIATTGSDQNPGTIDKPWGSFVNASEVGTPGDTIYVRGGTYQPAKNTYFYKNGTAAAPITFRAFPNESVLIDGVNLPADTALIYISSNHFVMQDIELANSKHNGIALDSGPNKNGAISSTIRNCKIRGSFMGGIAITGARDSVVDKCTIYNNVGTNNAHTGAPWTAAVYAAGSNNITVSNSTIYNNQGEGLIFYLSNGCSALGNTIHDNFSVNMYLDNARSCLVEGNFIYTQGDLAYYNNGIPAAAVQCGNESYNGIDAPNSSSDNKVINNVIVVLNKNYAFLSNNFFSKGGGLKNFLFAHNTIYRKVTTGSVVGFYDVIHIEAGIPVANENVVVCNNIIATEVGGKLAGVPLLTGISLHHNLYFGGESGVALGATDLSINPNLSAPGGFNPAGYIPKINSPVFAAGAVLPAILKDFNGATRNQTADLGAFIAGSTHPTLPNVTALQFVSPPSITPNPARAGEMIAFTAAASGSGTLIFTWEFGDGSSLTGASVTKIYNAPGVYSGRLTVTDGQSSIVHTFDVNAAALEFSSSMVILRLNLSKPNTDSISIIGDIPLQNGFQLNGTKATVALGSFVREVTLNTKGASADRSFKLAAKTRNGVIAAPAGRFKFAVKRAALAAEFQKLGLTLTPGQSAFETSLNLRLGEYQFQKTQPVLCLISGVRKP